MVRKTKEEAQENLEGFVLKPLYTKKEITEIKSLVKNLLVERLKPVSF